MTANQKEVEAAWSKRVPHKSETWAYRYATLKAPLTMSHYLGYWNGGKPAMAEVPCPAGTRVRIVMVSRFGDVGITEQLDAETVYGVRVELDALTDFSNDPKPTPEPGQT